VLAQEEAQRLGNNYIGTEHILLGIISEGESLAAKVLETLGVNLAKVRQEVEAIVGRGGQTVQQEMVFTPRAKRVIELAFEEARQLNHNYIGTEHLLLGLIREGEGVAARVLTNLGVDPAKVRVLTTLLLGAEGQPHAPKGKSKTPTLDAYGRDLTTLARENKLDPVIGRANEIERVIQIRSHRSKRNTALIGEEMKASTFTRHGHRAPICPHRACQCDQVTANPGLGIIRDGGQMLREFRHLLDEGALCLISIFLIINFAQDHTPHAVQASVAVASHCGAWFV
jgi:ATP-dependent Clp protease ATP-binding subunit ClpC